MTQSLSPPVIDDLGIGGSAFGGSKTFASCVGSAATPTMSRPSEAALHAAIVRSPHAAARIVSIDVATSPLWLCPALIAVLTGRDIAADGIGVLQSSIHRNRRDGRPMPQPPVPACWRSTFVAMAGDPVADRRRRDAWRRAGCGRTCRRDLRCGRRPSPMPWRRFARRVRTVRLAGATPPTTNVFVFQQGDRAATDAAFARARPCGQAVVPDHPRLGQSDGAARRAW